MSDSTPIGRRPTRIAQIGLVAASLAVPFLLVELCLILVGYDYTPLEIQVSQNADFRSFHIFEDNHFVYDPDLIWRPRRNVDVFNNQGFRGPVLETPKPQGAYRILTVGDSNTLGFTGPEGAHWPMYLGQLLRDDHPEVTVVNAGVWGYTSFQGVARLEESLAFEPDLVLVSFGSNDAHRVLRSDQQYANSPLRSEAWGRGLSRFRIGQLFLATADRLDLRRAAQLQPRVSVAEYRANLRRMVAMATVRGAETVLLTRPYTGSVSNVLNWKYFASEYQVAAAEVAEETNTTLIDIYTLFRGKNDLFVDDSHFTAEGYRLAAELVLEHIRPIVLRGLAQDSQ